MQYDLDGLLGLYNWSSLSHGTEDEGCYRDIIIGGGASSGKDAQ